MHVTTRTAISLVVAFTGLFSGAASQSARISEEMRVLSTYPFSEPNPIPILTRDQRLYPYHTFEGYSNDAEPQEWKVVHLENDLLEVFVLPEVGGKIWGAVVKETGHEFIYRNEVMKFRNIALRGPWTSGGIELNFGVIGHSPATATPVDYTLRENSDGSVSCVVGTMDLPSRTHWRVEVRLPADRAYFETNVLWYNPTPLEQPYYNWMTAAAFAQYDLEMSMPGTSYLTHPGDALDWPTDPEGRYLPNYANNTFGSHKSYHVVGELHDFFGGYYREEDYGFGHWSRYEEMPGQKLWLWALSREGGVWEDLLTDTDGQYVEFQAGRLLVQYSPGNDINPITQAAFKPGVADRWSETWFPLEGIGGLTDASREGAMYVSREEGAGSGERGADVLTVNINAFGDVVDTLLVTSGERLIGEVPIAFSALRPEAQRFEIPNGAPFRVELASLELDYSSDPAARALSRPFETDPEARESMSEADIQVFEAKELLKARRYEAARELFAQALTIEPWNREALLGLADLNFRRGLYEPSLAFANKALQLDAYDADANFLAGNVYRALGKPVDAREAFGWAARSMQYRSVAYVQLAELSLASGDLEEAARYAGLALDYDRISIPARRVLAIVGRKSGDTALASRMFESISEIDPLNHFPLAEAVLRAPGSSADILLSALRSEYPDQTLLELAIDYARCGSIEDAVRVLTIGQDVFSNPLFRYWHAWLLKDSSLLPAEVDPTFVFPYRRETHHVLQWANQHDAHWSTSYLLALNLWALDREDEAATWMESLQDTPDFAPFYVARAQLLDRVRGTNQEPDLRRALELDGTSRMNRIHLIRHLQNTSKWENALVESAIALEQYPDDFNLDLLHVRSLNNLGRPFEAIEILANTHVLPSENARESHMLYEQAHVIAALDAMDDGDHREALGYLEAVLEWPENLGQGRPYDPEERIVRFLMAQVHSHLGNRERAHESYEAVVGDEEYVAIGVSPLDLLAIPALAELRGPETLTSVVFDEHTQIGQLAGELIATYLEGGDVDATIMRLALEHSGLFQDLAGSILLRALTAGDNQE